MNRNYAGKLKLISRRRLVGLTGTVGLGLLAMACGQPPAPSPTAAAPKPAPTAAAPTPAAAAPTPAAKAQPAAPTQAPSKPKQLDTITMRMDWVTTGYHAPFYVGIDKGYYAEQGIKLETADGQGSGPTTTLVGTDKDMIGLAAATNVVLGIQRGVPAKLIAGMFRKSGFGVTFLKESNITKPQDLKGKRLGDAAGSATQQIFPAFLKANRMRPEDIELVNVDAAGQQNLLLIGRVDVITTAGGTGANIRGATGKETGNLFFADWGLPHIGLSILTSNKLVAEQPDLIRRYLAATVKAWAYAWENIDEAATIINRLKPEMPKNSALEVMKDTRTLLYSKATQGKPFGWMADEDVQGTIDLVAEYMATPETKDQPKPTIKQVATNDFLPK